MSKYQIGQRVVIVDKRTTRMARDGAMDRWLNKTLTIKSECDGEYRMEECPEWHWWDKDIEGLEEELNIDPIEATNAFEAIF